jgi:hypothetical protein
MYARAVDDAAARLNVLRHEMWGRLSVAALALAFAVVAAALLPELAVPLLFGGLAMGVLALQALFRHWDLVDRLSGDRDAYVIPEVLAYASREAEIERRQSFAALIRRHLPQHGFAGEEQVVAAADELEALASDLDDRELVLDPAAAVACMRLLTDFAESPPFNTLPSEVLRWRVRQIRSGFAALPDSAFTESGGFHQPSGDLSSSRLHARTRGDASS